MSAVPQNILSDALKSAMKDRRLLTAVFTTYTFDSGFFENHVLPVFLDAEMATDSIALQPIRTDDALRDLIVRPQVFYDVGQLQEGQDGSASLDVGRHSVRMGNGAAFHPKVVCALVEDRESSATELLVACLSANLTRSGWWENVECGQVETIRHREKSTLKEPLLKFLRWLGKNIDGGDEGTALGEVIRFLDDPSITQQSRRQVGLFPAQFHFTGTANDEHALVDFLKSKAGKDLQGMSLEVISPYFDKKPSSAVLDGLIKAFKPKEVRIHLPESQDGIVNVEEKMYDYYQDQWGRLPEEITRNGKGQDAKKRRVHAKVYRFFRKRPKQEFWYVGSANLTEAAHHRGGNMEAGFLVQCDLTGRTPDFWLKKIGDAEQPEFNPITEEEEGLPTSDLTRLSLRYDWQTEIAEAFWNGGKNSGIKPPGQLTLEAGGVVIGNLPVIVPGVWKTLSRGLAEEIQKRLEATSHFKVRHGDEMAMILVQENGMAQKPGPLQKLTVAEILRYWALLTPAQRQDSLERIVHRIEAEKVGEIFKLDPSAGGNLFEEFAGYFHSFQQMEQDVDQALAKGRKTFAEIRLFGKKHDSLGRVLEKVDEHSDPVNRYLLAMCARQSLKLVRANHRGFWQEFARKAGDLQSRIDGIQRSAKAKLQEGETEDLTEFLEWFEEEFMHRERTKRKVGAP